MGYQAKTKRTRRWYVKGGNRQPKRDEAVMGRVMEKLTRKGEPAPPSDVRGGEKPKPARRVAATLAALAAMANPPLPAGGRYAYPARREAGHRGGAR